MINIALFTKLNIARTFLCTLDYNLKKKKPQVSKAVVYIALSEA